MGADPIGPQHIGDRGDLADPVGQQTRLGLVHVDVVDGDRVDPARRQQPAVRPHPLQVAARPPVLPEQRAARVSALHLAHDRVHGDIVPVVEHAQGESGVMGLPQPLAGERRFPEPYDMEQAVQQPTSAGGGDGRRAALTRKGEPLLTEKLRVVGTAEVEDQVERDPLQLGVAYDPAPEPPTGLSHFPVHRLHQRTRSTDQRPPAADRPEGGGRQPGRVDTLGQDGHGKRHETPN